MICLILFVFSVLFGEGETVTYKPTDVILINCGATSNIHTDGRTWTPEQKNVFASNLANASFTSMATELIFPEAPYKTVRIFQSNFTYSVPVSPGWKFLRLYFYPTRYGSDLDAAHSSFSVTVNGITLLKNFKPALNTKKDPDPESSDYGFIIKEFIVPVLGGHNKTLNLTLTPSPHSLAFLNGLEIVSMPDRFYTKGGFDGYVRNVGSNSEFEFEIDNTTVLETVYRLNIGGGSTFADVKVTELMFRRWLSDGGFLLGETSIIPNILIVEATINYTEKTPAYVAPEEVYYSFIRSMGNTEYVNLTWLFPVDAGFNYLVRLHFCETLFEVTKPNQRLFNIIIGNQIAKKDTDVFNLSGGHGIPLYLDFNIFMASDARKSGKRPNLQLDLAPSRFNNYDAFLNGVEILKLNDSQGNLAGPNLNTLGGEKLHVRIQKKKEKLHVLETILIALGSVIGIAITYIFVFMLMKRKNRKDDNRVAMFKILLKQYTYAELKKITKSFSRTLGKGGFGTVYRGNLYNGRKVAVKVLKDLKGNGEDFINEVTSMSQTSHVNIVSLLGFCNEGSKRAIVYELLENGSLDQFISRKKSSTLDVTTLYGIALGIARGLEYLHYGCRTRIVHFDIKPQNILLDGNLCPKVSDFGLAKLCEKRQSIMSLTDARGTIGYIAPEVFSRTYGGVSHKSDVYSYGMLVLDMIGARNKKIAASNASTEYFPDWIYKDLENGEQTWRFGDEITGDEKETAKKMILVGLWCIQPCPIDRPPMNRVVEMMEGSLAALEVPPNPSMHISTRLMAECSSLSDSGETDNNSNCYVLPSLTAVKSNEIVELEYIN